MHDATDSCSTTIDIGELPSVPHVLLKLIDTCHDVDASFDELTQIIRQDSALCAKILSVTNSPTYAQWNGIEDFNRLVVVLGLGPIKAISITAVVQQFFSQFDENLGKCMGLLWHQSLTCAHTAKALAALTGYASIDEAYLTGLLHNLGQLAILKHTPEQYTSALLNNSSNHDLTQLERKLVGACANEIGAQMLTDSTADSFITDAIFFQDADAELVQNSSALIKLINLAKRLTYTGFHADDSAESASKLFGLNQDILDDMASSVAATVKNTAATYGIELSNATPTNLDDQEIRLKLAKKVKDFALLHGTLNVESTIKTAANPWEDTCRNLKILFGLNNAIIFEHIKEKDLLTTAATYNTSSIPEPLCIPATSNQSAICEAAKSGKPVFAAALDIGVKVSVLDHQLKRLLGTDAFVAIPLINNSTLEGVVISGVSRSQKIVLQRSSSLLMQYFNSASRMILEQVNSQEDGKADIKEQHADHVAKTKELVHEANNPIGVIKNYLYVLSSKLEGDSEISEQLETISSEIDRVASIINRMRDIDQAPKNNLEESSVNINHAIQSLVNLYTDSIFVTHNITAELELDESIENQITKRSSLTQVLTNLIKNSVEAMSSGGTFKISTRNDIALNNNNYIEIRVIDSGPGIPEALLDRLFQPVESTKGASHSGLGLSIVKNLVVDMGGSINVQNRKQGGAEFILYLPKSNQI